MKALEMSSPYHAHWILILYFIFLINMVNMVTCASRAGESVGFWSSSGWILRTVKNFISWSAFWGSKPSSLQGLVLFLLQKIPPFLPEFLSPTSPFLPTPRSHGNKQKRKPWPFLLSLFKMMQFHSFNAITPGNASSPFRFNAKLSSFVDSNPFKILKNPFSMLGHRERERVVFFFFFFIWKSFMLLLLLPFVFKVILFFFSSGFVIFVLFLGTLVHRSFWLFLIGLLHLLVL